jgi:hypothetical protein
MNYIRGSEREEMLLCRGAGGLHRAGEPGAFY